MTTSANLAPAVLTPDRPRPRRRAASGALVVLCLVAGVLLTVDDSASAKTPKAKPKITLGIDVASHQHPGGAAINWRSVRASGVRFVLVKATEGAGKPKTVSTNPWFAADWKGAKTAGLLRGAYHFARPRLPMSTAISDAKRFVAVISAAGHGPGELAPVLDLEVTGGLGPKNLSEWTATWLSEVTLLTGRKPIIYSGKGFWTSYLGNTTRFAKYPLWFAQHTSALQPSALPGGWKSWTFWQYSAKGHVAGIRTAVDLSWSCGTPGLGGKDAPKGACSGAPPKSTGAKVTTIAKKKASSTATSTAKKKS